MAIPSLKLPIELLNAGSFKPFGQVIETQSARSRFTINEGYAERFHDLVELDLTGDQGRPILSIFRARARRFPMRLSLLERHPKGSQAFIALAPDPFMVVVAEAGTGSVPSLQTIRCFLAAPGQGVNYARGTWHHPLIALATGDFLVVDRGADAGDNNCDEFTLDTQDIHVDWTGLAPVAR